MQQLMILRLMKSCTSASASIDQISILEALGHKIFSFRKYLRDSRLLNYTM